MQCDHVQLFELGSVYHKQYLVNFAIPYLPLSTVEQYRGIAPLSKLALYVSLSLSLSTLVKLIPIYMISEVIGMLCMHTVYTVLCS